MKPLSRKIAASMAVLLLIIVLGTGCQSVPKTTIQQDDTLYQVSLLNALMLGEYDGFIPVSTLQQKGDIGIGTFDTLDGEMIMLDTVVYKAKATGEVFVVDPDVTVPFAVVTTFDADMPVLQVKNVGDLDALKKLLDGMIAQNGNDFNCFYVARIGGTFSLAHVRSVPAQEKPYKRLSEIAATQKEFIYENLEGTIVAFRCPDYVEGINLPKWHLHFLSADMAKGGHLLDANLSQGNVQIDTIREFNLVLPENNSFAQMDIANDLSRETSKVEGKK
ncbi:alpha-acetolactate decarboxylase [Sphaerochaeta pleomorpha str. Grapes]|uniref:Alpha-acetolactate decarboxylase n=1 Tax=Sphaerochaeta pleomorpha (strain ATCC BAA-1885 / DSM 22778 / Grapes) TaxID=158190 RepID=G8QVQ7_SPHPG|nr:acetolactate decarboxylase [Sphaerochaeta pleomorpha]AEV29349.1 alpha-acetolactate decarboxylase [Sphaerochaeta pleomorpha str. Grapes]